MSKILSFLTQFNCKKQLFWGFFIGILALGAYPAVYAAIVAASCFELKDTSRGCRWDWIDWTFTVIGGVIASIIHLI